MGKYILRMSRMRSIDQGIPQCVFCMSSNLGPCGRSIVLFYLGEEWWCTLFLLLLFMCKVGEAQCNIVNQVLGISSYRGGGILVHKLQNLGMHTLVPAFSNL